MDRRFALCLLVALGLAACDAGEGEAPPRVAPALDPVVARALNDPLMSDPDLALRSEANALLTYADAAPLPLIEASPQAAERAREAARTVLLEGGPIPPLTPLAAGEPGGAPWADLATTADLLAAAGVPAACRSDTRKGFAWAAQLPAPAAIMPHGMVDLAAGSDAGGCRVRLVRYRTAASAEDVLAWHNTLAQRAGLAIRRHAEPEAMLAARGKDGTALRVRIRPAENGMSAVDLVFWKAP